MGNAAREPVVIIQSELHEATTIKAAMLSGSERVVTHSALEKPSNQPSVSW